MVINMIRSMILFIYLIYGNAEYRASPCICTTVPCPVQGNNILMEGYGEYGSYYYEIHGNYPVVVKAQVAITDKDLDQGTATTSCTQRYARMLDDENLECDAGHILAHRLSGPGNQPINIFPQKPSVNRGSYETMENNIYQCIQKANETVIANLSWTFNYTNISNTRPSTVTYSASFSGGTCNDMVASFDNEGV